MQTLREYELYCHFCGIGKKMIRASSYAEAKEIIEDDETIQFDEIIRLTKPCWVDDTLSKPLPESRKRVEYRNWGAE